MRILIVHSLDFIYWLFSVKYQVARWQNFVKEMEKALYLWGTFYQWRSNVLLKIRVICIHHLYELCLKVSLFKQSVFHYFNEHYSLSHSTWVIMHSAQPCLVHTNRMEVLEQKYLNLHWYDYNIQMKDCSIRASYFLRVYFFLFLLLLLRWPAIHHLPPGQLLSRRYLIRAH